MNFIELKNITPMEDLLKDSDSLGHKKYAEGELVKGTIISKKGSAVCVDIGFKAESFINKAEFSDIDKIEEGDEIEVYIERTENRQGRPTVSYEKAIHQKEWNKLISSAKEGDSVQGVMTSKIKGGLVVNVGEIETFLPGSHIDVVPVKDVAELMGKEFTFQILKINYQKKNIILSRRKIIEKEKDKKKDTMLAKIEKGDVYKGIVKNILDFGAFIDIDGLDGLLHITDISWNRISHPSEVLRMGQEVEVMIIDINKEKKRVSLGLKQKTQDPWVDIEKRFPVNQTVKGVIVNLMKFGVFVKLEDGVEGLLHTSEISWNKKNVIPSQMFSIGDEVEVIVIGLDQEQRKIYLSIKQLEDNPWDDVEKNNLVNSKIEGTVVHIGNFSAKVKIANGLEGTLHISDMSWTRKVSHPSEMVKLDDKIEVKVLQVDKENLVMNLGLKQLEKDPWTQIESSALKEGEIVEGKISNITKHGAFVRLKEGVDAFMYSNQADIPAGKNIGDVFKIDSVVKSKIIKMDIEKRIINLSINQLKRDSKKEDDYSKTSTVSMGEITKDLENL